MSSLQYQLVLCERLSAMHHHAMETRNKSRSCMPEIIYLSGFYVKILFYQLHLHFGGAVNTLAMNSKMTELVEIESTDLNVKESNRIIDTKHSMPLVIAFQRSLFICYHVHLLSCSFVIIGSSCNSQYIFQFFSSFCTTNCYSVTMLWLGPGHA